MSYDEVSLVTGYPFFRARKMVDQLLQTQPKSLVYVIAREKFGDEVAQHLDALPKQARERLIVLDGDAAAMDLGLSGKEYRELAHKVDRVHHCAQVTYPAVGRSMAAEVNVGATREIVEFGRCCTGLKSIVMHSAAGVSGDRTGVVYEHELNAGQGFRTPVEQSLARAERIARNAMSSLPISVIRPTQIVGDSATGEVDRLDGPYMMTLVMLSSPPEVAVPLPTRGDAPLNLVPIDFVVRAAQHLARLPAALGRTVHLADPNPLTVRQVFELVARASGRKLATRFIPSGVAKAVLGVPGLHLVSKNQRALVDLLATNVRYDTSQADDLLRGTGIHCPSFETYVDHLVSFVRRRVEEGRARADLGRLGVPLGKAGQAFSS